MSSYPILHCSFISSPHISPFSLFIFNVLPQNLMSYCFRYAQLLRCSLCCLRRVLAILVFNGALTCFLFTRDHSSFPSHFVCSRSVLVYSFFAPDLDPQVCTIPPSCLRLALALHCLHSLSLSSPHSHWFYSFRFAMTHVIVVKSEG